MAGMMKRVMVVLAMVALLVPLVVGVAYAGGKLIQCSSVPCVATGNSYGIRLKSDLLRIE